MKKPIRVLKRAAPFAAAAFLAGCWSFSSPYDYVENWVIRDDPVRTFVIPADVFYVQGELYTSVSVTSLLHDYAQTEVGNGRFRDVARVFSPLIATPEDLERALDWYFKHHHEKNRAFVFIGEGEGGAFLKAYEEERAEALKKKGLVASFYTDGAHKGFVTDDMVEEVKAAAARHRYRTIWGREIPKGRPAK